MKKLVSKLLALMLAAALLVGGMGSVNYAFAAEENVSETVMEFVDSTDAVEVLIPAGSSIELVKERLGRALIKNADQFDLQTLDWEYECEGKEKVVGLDKNTAWGSIEGFMSSVEKKILFVPTKMEYKHVALAANDDGEYKVRLKDSKVVLTINKASKLASKLELNSNFSMKYYSDPAVLENEMFRKLVKWSTSVLPAGLSKDDFTIEYKAELGAEALDGLKKIASSVFGGFDFSKYTSKWVPVKGAEVNIPGIGSVGYPKMGAGEHQVRVTFNGNSEYNASETVEATINVTKGDVKVKVKSLSINAGEALPSDLVTVDANDLFDIYTIYAGIDSNIGLSLYMQLPEKYTNETLMKVVDPVVKAISGRTLTEMLNDGMTVGEIRNLFNTGEVIKALETIGIDTGVFGTVIATLDKLPGIADNIRIAFGQPSHAGLYTATAIATNKNYNVGIGLGEILVKMNSKNVKLVWNSDVTKITKDQVASYDFGATLTMDGVAVKDQSSVKYLYSGITKKFVPYLSSKAPTEPGSYLVTVSVIGGDYFAAPITRTIKIEK